MKGIRLRFVFWILGWVALFLVANLKLRAFPHIFIVFWSLLPILSLGFSMLMRSKLELRIGVAPTILDCGKQGEWLCELHNHSRMMAFFLRFPQVLITGGKRSLPLDIMLRPGESRSFRLAFELDHIGEYSLKAKTPIFEDLLGFFWLSFAKHFTTVSSQCIALPAADKPVLTEDQAGQLTLYSQPIDRRSFSAMTDEVFSIDPIANGESLAHAHWKLSARMQEWMIKHYSERGRQPISIILDPMSMASSPEARFVDTVNTLPTDAEEAALTDRDHLLQAAYQLVQMMLSTDSPVVISDRSGDRSEHFMYHTEAEAARIFLGSFAFKRLNDRWQLNMDRDNRLFIFVQQLDDESLGTLIKQARSGLDFLLISFRGNHDARTVEQLEDHEIRCLWLED